MDSGNYQLCQLTDLHDWDKLSQVHIILLFDGVFPSSYDNAWEGSVKSLGFEKL